MKRPKIYETVTANINPDGSPSIIAWRGKTFDTIPLSDGKGGKIAKVSPVDPRHLSALVTAARSVPDAWERGDLAAAVRALSAALAPFTTDPAPVSPPFSYTPEDRAKARLEYLRGEIEAERISYGEIAELQDLAPYIDKDDTVLLEWVGVPEFPEDEDPAPPVPGRKPYGYAVKANTKGYLAIQGREAWFESEPVGWAVFGTEDYARAMLEENHSMIGTAAHEGGEIVPVYRD